MMICHSGLVVSNKKRARRVGEPLNAKIIN